MPGESNHSSGMGVPIGLHTDQQEGPLVRGEVHFHPEGYPGCLWRRHSRPVPVSRPCFSRSSRSPGFPGQLPREGALGPSSELLHHLMSILEIEQIRMVEFLRKRPTEVRLLKSYRRRLHEEKLHLQQTSTNSVRGSSPYTSTN